MKNTALILSILGLAFAARGTAGFTPAVRAATDAAHRTTATLGVKLWLKFGKPLWQNLVALIVAIGVAAHLTARRPRIETRTTSADLSIGTSLSASVHRAKLFGDAWRESVDGQLLHLAEQIGKAQADLTSSAAQLRAETDDKLSTLRQRQESDDLRSFGWIGIGILCQIAASAIGLFTH